MTIQYVILYKSHWNWLQLTKYSPLLILWIPLSIIPFRPIDLVTNILFKLHKNKLQHEYAFINRDYISPFSIKIWTYYCVSGYGGSKLTPFKINNTNLTSYTRFSTKISHWIWWNFFSGGYVRNPAITISYWCDQETINKAVRLHNEKLPSARTIPPIIPCVRTVVLYGQKWEWRSNSIN